MSERSMKSSCGFIIGPSRFFDGIEIPDHYLFASVIYLATPFPVSFVPAYSLETAGISSLLTLILHVLSVAAFAKIVASIVEGISVDVVPFFIWSAAKQGSRQNNGGIRGFSSLCIEFLVVAIPRCLPIPLVNPVEVLSVNNRVLPLRKWNQTVGFVKRLGDCVSLHAVFHRSSFKGLTQPHFITVCT